VIDCPVPMLVGDFSGPQVGTGDITPWRRLARYLQRTEERAHIDAVGRALIAVEPLFAALLVRTFRRNVLARHQPDGETEISGHAEHDLSFRIDRDAAPVEGSEIAGIDERSFQRWRSIAAFVVQLLEPYPADHLVEHADTPHVAFLKRLGLEAEGRGRLRRCREVLGNGAAGRRLFRHIEEGFAGAPVEDIDVTLLGRAD